MKDYLAEAKGKGAPLIEGDLVRFVWEGGGDPPRLVGDFNKWGDDPEGEVPAEKIEGGWTYTLSFPDSAYMEYHFRVGDEKIHDPLNPKRFETVFGHSNSFFYMPEGKPTPWRDAPSGGPRGTLTQHSLPPFPATLGEARDLWLYAPPLDQPAPLLLVYDGNDYLKQAGIETLVDNLIAAGRIRPLAMALIANRDESRMVEYGANELTLAWIRESVLPYARSELNLLDPAAHPGAYGVLGASMGGLMALYTGLRMSQLFGRVYAQAGAYVLWQAETVAFELVTGGFTRRLSIFMDVGSYDFLLDANRQMRDALLDKGYPLTYQEFHAGHNYTAWRDNLAHGLETLFPPEGK